MEKLEFDDFAGYFGLWADLFRPFIESKEMYDIYQKLKSDGSKEHIVPSSDSTFRVFGMSNPADIKSVWYLMDPYPRRYRNKANQANGIAMDCSNSPDGKIQPSLELFYEGIQADTGKSTERSPSLDYLVKQGVLLLNTDLTCKLNKTGSHKRVWEPFQKFFLENIMSKYTGVVYVLSGESSERMERYIYPVNNYILKVEHPMAAGHRNMSWNHKNVFTTTNKLLTENKKTPIIWNRNDFEEEEAPF